MTQITRVPVGLQDFLGTQAQGKNPSELGQVIAPTLDLKDFYSIQLERWQFKGVAQFSGPAFDSWDVPEGEVWILTGAGFRHKTGAIIVAGDGYKASMILSNQPNSSGPLNNHPITRTFEFTIVDNPLSQANNERYDFESLPGIVAYSGSKITYRYDQVDNTSQFSPEAALRYLRLEL